MGCSVMLIIIVEVHPWVDGGKGCIQVSDPPDARIDTRKGDLQIWAVRHVRVVEHTLIICRTFINCRALVAKWDALFSTRMNASSCFVLDTDERESSIMLQTFQVRRAIIASGL